jgi:rhamnogalacturonyl hydrolase YesR
LRHEITGDAPRKAKAIARQEWMIENTPPDQPGYFWGNHFDFVTLAGCKPKNMPIIVWTSLIGRAFLAGYERTQDQRFLDVARGVCLWILRLPPEQTGSGNCLSYVPFAQSLIHNSIMLGAAMLADTWRHTRDPELLEVARSAMLYSCRRQREDGSWWYGETPKYQWIDNFHTGYNLDSVKCCHDSAGEDDFQPHFQRGLRYFEEVFFEENGIPKYYYKKTYLVDIQCMAQSIESFSYCSDEDPTCLELSKKVADWAIDHMQDRDGHFYFRQYPLIKAKMAYIHWGQATMFKALALLLSKM